MSNEQQDQQPREMNPGQASFVKQQTLCKGNFLSFEKYTYRDVTGRERTWEVVERTNKSKAPGVADAVAIVAVLKRLLHYDCILLVKQYRPPMKGYTIEFPAGLVDQGETPSEAALRELKEETGYTGTVSSISPSLVLDAGISASDVNLVHMQIDGDDSVNIKPSPQPDDGEHIEVLLLPFHKLRKKLEEMTKKGAIVDARVYTYAAALEQVELTQKKMGIS